MFFKNIYIRASKQNDLPRVNFATYIDYVGDVNLCPRPSSEGNTYEAHTLPLESQEIGVELHELYGRQSQTATDQFKNTHGAIPPPPHPRPENVSKL